VKQEINKMRNKYRAWCVNAKEMKRVVKIDMTSDVITCEIEVDSEYTFRPLFVTGEYPDVVLTQSTGIKDKNGADVYEGDIIEATISSRWTGVSRWIGVVKYSVERASYILEDINEFLSDFTYLKQSSNGFEIIGNIYENPELMEMK